MTWFGLAIASKTDLNSIQKTHNVRWVQCVGLQESHIFFCIVFTITIQLDVGMFDYINVN